MTEILLFGSWAFLKGLCFKGFVPSLPLIGSSAKSIQGWANETSLDLWGMNLKGTSLCFLVALQTFALPTTPSALYYLATSPQLLGQMVTDSTYKAVSQHKYFLFLHKLSQVSCSNKNLPKWQFEPRTRRELFLFCKSKNDGSFRVPMRVVSVRASIWC